MKGDWVQAKYLINPAQWSSQAQFVAPLRYCRLDQVNMRLDHVYCYICCYSAHATLMFQTRPLILRGNERSHDFNMCVGVIFLKFCRKC